MLKNVNTSKLDSPCELKQLILDQFGGEIVPGDLMFDTGYLRGNKRVCLVSVDDMEAVNKLFHSTDGHEVTLWCKGCTKETSSEIERPAKKSKNKKSRHAEKLEMKISIPNMA